SNSPVVWSQPTVVVFFAASVLLLIDLRASQAQEPGVAETQMRKDLVTAATKIHDLAVKGYMKSGGGNSTYTFDGVLQAKRDLFAAKLDLCDTKDKRVKTYEEKVADAAAWEDYVVKSARMASFPEIYTEKAKAYLLKSKIELEQAKKAK